MNWMCSRSRRASARRVVITAAGAAMIAIAPLGAQTQSLFVNPSADEPIVKGAPYSAESIINVKMRMFDGTQIDRSVTGRIYRDNLGRVRRDQTIIGLEALDPAKDVRAVVIIVDPVTNSLYTLVPDSKTANRLSIDVLRHGSPNVGGQHPKEEPLGKRDIDGIATIGYRMTTTIPVGQVGNDRPITVVDERWESSELKVIIESRHLDPRTGEVEYRLTKISRKEPPADLFKIPAGYKIVDIPPKGPESGRD